MASRMTGIAAFFTLVATILQYSLLASAQSVTVTNVGHDTAQIDWDITVEGVEGVETVLQFQISVDCQKCTPFNVSGIATSYTLTALKDNTPFQVCVTPYTASGIGSPQCAQFRTRISPRTVGALCVGIALVVSFFVLMSIDLMCRRHQIEVEDAKRDELLQQGWQTFKRRSTERVAMKKAMGVTPSPATARRAAAVDDFDNIGDVTFEEELPE